MAYALSEGFGELGLVNSIEEAKSMVKTIYLRKSIFVWALALFGVLALGAPNAYSQDVSQSTSQSTAGSASQNVPKSPTELLSFIHTTNQFEIEMGKLAQQKGVSKDVKQFGDRLVRDHNDTDKKVMALARENNLTVQALPPTPDQKQMRERLQGLSGEEFDKAFMTAMADAHTKAIQTIEQSVQSLGKSEVTDFARKLVPVLDQHRDMTSHGRHPASI